MKRSSLAKACLQATPAFWLLSLPLVGYGAYVGIAAMVFAAIVAALVSRRDPTLISAAGLLFSALWWTLVGAAAASLVLAIGMLLPRRVWHVSAAATGGLVVLTVLNPPWGPGHLASVSGLAMLLHAIALGTATLVELRDRYRETEGAHD